MRLLLVCRNKMIYTTNERLLTGWKSGTQFSDCPPKTKEICTIDMPWSAADNTHGVPPWSVHGKFNTTQKTHPTHSQAKTRHSTNTVIETASNDKWP